MSLGGRRERDDDGDYREKMESNENEMEGGTVHHRCTKCSVPMVAGEAFARLACGHAFHAECLYRTWGRLICTRCPPPPPNPRDGSRESSGFSPDFGDQPGGTAEMMDAVLGNNPCSKLIRGKYMGDPIINGLNGITPAHIGTIFSVGGGDTGVEPSKDYVERNWFGTGELFAEDLKRTVEGGATATDLRRRHNVDLRNLLMEGVTVEDLLRKGYVLGDFVQLRASFEDMTAADRTGKGGNLTFRSWSAHREALPVGEMVLTFDLNRETIFYRTCGNDPNLLLNRDAMFSARELKEMGMDATFLVETCGVDKIRLAVPGYSMEEWTGILGLRFRHLLTLGVRFRELGPDLLGWTNDESVLSNPSRFNESATGFSLEFSRAFEGNPPSSLPTHDEPGISPSPLTHPHPSSSSPSFYLQTAPFGAPAGTLAGSYPGGIGSYPYAPVRYQ